MTRALELGPVELRNKRKRAVKPKTINLRDVGKQDFAIAKALYPEQPGVDYHRPASRKECADSPRPCPFVSCPRHLYLDVTKSGSLQLNFPDIEPDELTESCAADLAESGPLTHEEVALRLNTTRARVHQIEAEAFEKLSRRGVAVPALRELWDVDARRLARGTRL